MPKTKSSFSYSFRDGNLHVSGSELFVSQQLEFFKDAILAHATDRAEREETAKDRVSSEYLPSQSETANDDTSEISTNPYPNVLDVHDSKAKILIHLGSGTKSEKTVRLCLMYLWAKTEFLGETTVNSTELRELCQEHAVYDSTNFASILKKKKEYFRIDGVKNSNSKNYSLTVPGVARAKELLEQLNS